jgi:hypothetical protein
MTARYWIKQRFTVDDPILKSLTSTLNVSREEQEQLKNAVAENKALTILQAPSELPALIKTCNSSS